MKKFFLFIIAAFLMIIFQNSPVYPQDNADIYIEQGKEFSRKGNFEKAALSWKKAADILYSKGSSEKYLETVISLAHAWQTAGYHQKALTAFEQAWPVFEKSRHKNQKALFLNSVSDLNLSLGNIDEAVKYIKDGLQYAQENPYTHAVLLNNAGNILCADGDYHGAIPVYMESLYLIEPLKDKAGFKSVLFINMTRAALIAGDIKKALSFLKSAESEIQKMPDSNEKASNLISLALLIINQPEKWKQTGGLTGTAYNALNKAVNIAENMENHLTLSQAYGYLGNLYENKKRLKDAVNLTGKAVFFAQQGAFSQSLYLWQWQLGRVFKAQGDVKNALKSFKNAIATLNPVQKELFKGYRGQEDIFNRKIKPVYIGLADLLLKQAEKAEEDKDREAGLIEARDVMELLKTSELQEFFEDECITAMQKNIKALNRAPAGTAILYPIILPDRLVLLLTMPDKIKQICVPIDSKTFEKNARRFRRDLQTRPNNRFLYGASDLYNCLIKPIEAEFKGDINTLVAVPDGVLRLIPFSTLHDGEHFLIERYALATIPAVTLTDMKPMDVKNSEILITGLSESVGEFPALAGVSAELQDIKKIMNGNALLQDKNFTLENLNHELKHHEYNIVHMATHGVFSNMPEKTFLLTYDGKLTMNKLEELIRFGRFREKRVELLTLSACQTALGDERAALGLAGVALKAGAESALASLWFIDDEAASLAVREFYRELKNSGVSKAKALQHAQKKLISKPKFWHPAYWGPFLLIGSWI